jgi:predicted CoA-binding protein
MKDNQWQVPNVIRGALELKRIAIVGLSSNELRASNFVARYMRYHGYDIVPVNPAEKEILGLPCYPSLSDIPGGVEMVDVFRQPDVVPDIAAESLAIGAKCLWLQFGVISEEGASIAARGGMEVVMDRCLKIEHARYFGRLHWLGMNTGNISARRTKPD